MQLTLRYLVISEINDNNEREKLTDQDDSILRNNNLVNNDIDISKTNDTAYSNISIEKNNDDHESSYNSTQTKEVNVSLKHNDFSEKVKFFIINT